MFRKPFKVKSNSRLKTTDKKKLKTDLLKSFPMLDQYPSTEVMNIKSSISVMDITSHSGDSVSVYLTSKYPCFIQWKGTYYPTVFLLWDYPRLVYTFETHPPVYEKIHGGADLMLPGVLLDVGSSLLVIKKGDCVAVNLSDNAAVVAVGEAAVSGEEMISGDRRGKCVKVLHCLGDHLCELAPEITRPVLLPEPSEPIEPEMIPLDTPQESTTQISYAQITSNTPVETNDANVLQKKTEQLHISGDLPGGVSSSLDSMEDLLNFCFFKSILTSAKNAQLPLLTNLFYKNHMMEVYPNGCDLDIKKSKFKKLSTFLESMSHEGVIEIESTTSGIHKITKINYSHPLVVTFSKAHRDTFSQKVQPVRPEEKGPNITESYRINSAVLPLFSLYDYKKGDILNVGEVRKVITSYVKSHDLQDDSDKRFVMVDQLLEKVLKKPYNSSLTWEDIMTMIVSLMAQSYQVAIGPSKTISGKGKLPPIEILTANRAGNKKVTLVNNLSLYGINLQEFSKECQHGVAASTTINDVPNLKAEQVQVQGSHINFVGKLLTEKYKVPKRYIRGWNPK